MQNIIVIAGYTKKSHIQAMQSYFTGENIVYVCTYARRPLTDTKQEYLTLFDQTFDLTTDAGVKDFEMLVENSTVRAVTCTQERDMGVYLQTLGICGLKTGTEIARYEALINKKTFKEVLGTEHPELVPTITVLTDENLDAARALSYPQVVKPTGLAGSSFVYIAHSFEELEDFYRSHSKLIQQNGTAFYEHHVDIIAETFVQGRQYSVNAYVNKEGKPTLCPIIRVIPASEMGYADTYSALQYVTEELHEDEYARLVAAINAVIKTFGIENTSVHFDTVIDPLGQWKFFEVGLRIGGLRRKIYQKSHGFDHFYNDLLNRMGRTIHIPKQIKHLCVVQKGSRTEGVMKQYQLARSVTEPNAPLVLEDKITKLGEEVKPVSLGGGTIVRHFVTGKELEQVLKTAHQVFDEIKFEITQQ